MIAYGWSLYVSLKLSILSNTEFNTTVPTSAQFSSCICELCNRNRVYYYKIAKLVVVAHS